MNRLFNQISIVLRIFRNKIFINCILVALLCVCILFTNFTLCEVKSIDANYDIVTSINNKNTILYMVSSNLALSQSNTHLDISKLQGLQSIGKMNYSSVKVNSQISNIYIYNQAIIEHIDIPLSKGTWISPAQYTGNITYYPIVINKETTSLKYNTKTQIQLKNGDNLNVYVCGVLDKDQKFLNLSAATNAVNADHLVRDCNNNSISYFAVQELFPDDLTELSFGSSALFFFFDDISSDITNENYKILRNQGYAYTYETFIENSRYQLRQGYTFYLPLLISLIILSIIGSISFTVLTVKSNQEYYSCFLLCGGRKKDCIFLSLLNCLLIIFLSLIATITITVFLIQVGGFVGWYKISVINFLASIGVYSAFLLMNLFINKFLLKSKTVSQLLKKEV